MSVEYTTDCAWASSWHSEGDGVQMRTFCHVHPEYFWYSGSWPTQAEEIEHMKKHKEALKGANLGGGQHDDPAAPTQPKEEAK